MFTELNFKNEISIKSVSEKLEEYKIPEIIFIIS